MNTIDIYPLLGYCLIRVRSATDYISNKTETIGEALAFAQGFNVARTWIARPRFVVVAHNSMCVIDKACTCVALKDGG